MKLRDYIKELQQVDEKYMDLEVVYSSDDEGNNYQKVNPGNITPCEFFSLEEYSLDLVDAEDTEPSKYNAVIIN